MLLRAHIAEMAIGDARSGKERHLQEPVEQDGDLAEEVLAVEQRRDQHVVERKQRDRQHRGGAHDVAQVGQRGEAPFRAMQAEGVVDEPGIDHEARHDRDQLVEAGLEPDRLEADVEAHDDRRRGREQIVRHDQHLAGRERHFRHGESGSGVMAFQ
jgi:hypothetical protein